MAKLILIFLIKDSRTEKVPRMIDGGGGGKFSGKEKKRQGEKRCLNPKCRSTRIHNRHAEGNVGAPIEGKPVPRSREVEPKYECYNCGNQFDDVVL